MIVVLLSVLSISLNRIYIFPAGLVIAIAVIGRSSGITFFSSLREEYKTVLLCIASMLAGVFLLRLGLYFALSPSGGGIGFGIVVDLLPVFDML